MKNKFQVNIQKLIIYPMIISAILLILFFNIVLCIYLSTSLSSTVSYLSQREKACSETLSNIVFERINSDMQNYENLITILSNTFKNIENIKVKSNFTNNFKNSDEASLVAQYNFVNYHNKSEALNKTDLLSSAIVNCIAKGLQTSGSLYEIYSNS